MKAKDLSGYQRMRAAQLAGAGAGAGVARTSGERLVQDNDRNQSLASRGTTGRRRVSSR
jgi:hypothetical protein